MSRVELPDPSELKDVLEHVAQFGVPSPGAAKLLDVGTDRYLRYFESEVLTGLVELGGATCHFFEGAYGSGKTHLLQLIGDLGIERGMAVAITDLSQAMSLEDWRLITLHVLQNIEAVIDGERLRSLPAILEALRDGGAVNSAGLATSSLPHAGFRTAMLRLVEGRPLTDAGADALRSYLMGQKVTSGLLRRVGVTGVKDPLSQRNAEQVLATVVAGLWHLGLGGTLLLFDETERTLVSRTNDPPKKLQVAANLMRRLIDGCTTGRLTGTVAVFAVLPGFLENCALHYDALGQRLQITRDDAVAPAWRWPVLPIDRVTETADEERFLSDAVELFERIAVRCGADTVSLHSELLNEGSSVLEENAGTGYRRDLMKLLATLTLNNL